MKKKPFLILSFIFLLLLISGCTINKNSEPVVEDNDVISTSSIDKDEPSMVDEAQNCSKIGEAPNVIDDRTGKPVPGGKSCCTGLKAINGVVDSNDKNVCGYHSGGSGLCAPCGNGKCEVQYGENRCSCKEDCR